MIEKNYTVNGFIFIQSKIYKKIEPESLQLSRISKKERRIFDKKKVNK
jgi:hypothetical protein